MIQNYIFSPSDLEDYLLCPFRFYASACLKVKPETEWEVELTPPEIGRLLHKILEKFLRQKKNQGEKERILSLMDSEIALLQKNRPHLSQALLKNQKKRITRALLSFLEQEESDTAPRKTLIPKYFEWSFGKDSPPLLLTTPGGPIKIRGRVDRIDVDPIQKRFLVVDYKTGSTKITGNQIRAGKSLQLPLYILAVQQLLLPDYEPIGGLYYQLSDMTRDSGILHMDRLPDFLEIHPRNSSLIPAVQWDKTFEEIKGHVAHIVSEIQKSEFPSNPEPCDAYCPYRDICRVRNHFSQISPSKN